jgi:uncharacterized protein YqhQ
MREDFGDQSESAISLSYTNNQSQESQKLFATVFVVVVICSFCFGSFIISLNKFLFSLYYVSGNVTSAKNLSKDNMQKSLFLCYFYTSGRDRQLRQ